MTTLRDGTKEEGKYKYNILITSQKKKHLFLIRSAKFRERIDAAVSASQRASKYALQKADIAVSRTATARSKGEMADSVADHARVDCEIAVATAREFAPDFKPSVLDRFERLRVRERYRLPIDPPSLAHVMPPKQQSIAQASSNTTPNHLPANNRIQASTDSTPQKQQSFPSATTRRHSMLQKQASIDFVGGGVLPQNTLQLDEITEPEQYPSKVHYQLPSEFNFGNQNQSNSSNYNAPNQNDYSQPNKSQYSSNSNLPPPTKYPVNLMHVQSFGAVPMNFGLVEKPAQSPYDAHLQKQAQYNAANPPGYQNYDAGSNQQLDSSQDYNHQSYEPQQQYQNPSMQSNYDQVDHSQHDVPGPSNLRRNSRQVNDTSRAPHIGSFSQSSIDHYDHYKRPPSRDSSVDRYTRAASRLSGSRQPSIDRSILPPANNSNPSQNANDTGSMERNIRAGSAFRNIASVAMSPAAPIPAGKFAEMIWLFLCKFFKLKKK